MKIWEYVPQMPFELDYGCKLWQPGMEDHFRAIKRKPSKSEFYVKKCIFYLWDCWPRIVQIDQFANLPKEEGKGKGSNENPTKAKYAPATVNTKEAIDGGDTCVGK